MTVYKMHNPFLKPHTPGQWMSGSLCWLVICLTLWAIPNYFLIVVGVPYQYKEHEAMLLFVSFIGPYVLIWRKGILAFPSNTAPFGWAHLVASWWEIILVGICLLWLILVLFCIAFSGPSQGGGWQ